MKPNLILLTALMNAFLGRWGAEVLFEQVVAFLRANPDVFAPEFEPHHGPRPLPQGTQE